MTSTNPLIALWAHPRSLSTATERVMRERQDCLVFHEPFLVYYYKHQAVREMPMLDDTLAQSESYESVSQRLSLAAEQQPVFFKDMSYYVLPRITRDPIFCRRVKHIFLVRDPRRSIASYFKLDPEFSLEEVGIEAQWTLYTFLRQELNIDPLVLAAEELAENPRQQLRRLWAYVGLPYVEHAFQWQADKIPTDWQYVRGWHASATASSGIRKDSVDADVVFNNVVKEAPHLQHFLDHHQPFYDKLKAQVK